MVPEDFLAIPKFVLLHVAKGGKFVPTHKPTSAKQVMTGLADLKRQLLLCQFFAEPRGAVSKCRLKSAWMPPGDVGVESYVRVLSRELASFEPKPFRANQSFLDRKARSWLKQHASSVLVIDCDKGLGDAIVLRSWLLAQVELQLRQGYVQITQEQRDAKLVELKYNADALVQFFVASGVLTFAEQKFLLSRFAQSSAGVFRVLAKVHKQPTASRPICNLRACWFLPFTVFLVEHLGPLVGRLETVIVSTDQLLYFLQPCLCKPGMRVVTLDIVNLYRIGFIFCLWWAPS